MAYLNQGGLDYFWEKVKEYANSTITVSPKEVSGSIATFDDGSETPVKSISVSIDPVQSGSGDPSPENVRPISGWTDVIVYVTGKNLLKGDKGQAGNNSVNLGTTSTDGGTDARISGLFLKAGTYTFSSSTTGKSISFYYRTEYDSASNRFASGSSVSTQITIEKDSYVKFWGYLSSGISTDEISWFQLELGSTATTYEPYKGTVYPISLPQTVYGGVLDVKNGTLTVTKKMVAFDGSTDENWNYQDSAHNAYVPCNDMLKTSNYSALIQCDKLIPSSHQTNIASGRIAGYYDYNSRYPNQNWIYTGTFDSVTSIAELRSWLAENPITVVYPLATPLTISLTPTEVRTILGYNNIYADSGNVDVVYYPQAAQKPTIEGVKTSTISVPTGTETDLLDEAITVKAGHSYAISYAAQFAANSTGYRRTKVYIDGTDTGVIAADIQAAVSGAETVCRGEHWFAASSDGEVMIKGLQNSGGALSASTSVRIIDLGN